MNKQLIKITGYASLVMLLLMVSGLTGCGGNSQAANVESVEEVIPTEKPTEGVVPTEEPTKEVIPTEEPTKEVIPTVEPTEEVVPTEEIIEVPPIMGSYAVAGNDPDYNNYEGGLEITASHGVYQWNWLDREPVGLGLPREDVVSVAWGDGVCNPVSYVIQEDGVLDGIYTEKDETGVGTEKSMPMEELGEGIEGEYMAFGSTPGGGMYMCDLDITSNGDIYDFHWDCGRSYYGVGIQRGNIVSVAFTDSKSKSCMSVSYLIMEDGTLDGQWAYVGDAKLGTDVAIPESTD